MTDDKALAGIASCLPICSINIWRNEWSDQIKWWTYNGNATLDYKKYNIEDVSSEKKSIIHLS